MCMVKVGKNVNVFTDKCNKVEPWVYVTTKGGLHKIY